jgi:hypothetical protein
MVALARTLADGQTPEQVVAAFKAKGIDVSERKLRERARKLGACRILGKTMILLPEHVDLIISEPDKWQSKSTSEATSTGGAADLLMQVTTTEEVLEHLTRISRTPKSGHSKRKPGNVLSLAQMRQR